MSTIINEIKKQFNNGEWRNFLQSIRISNIHGWEGQKIEFRFPVVAIVGENGIGKSTFLKAAVCAYDNKVGKSFYPSNMFMSTKWDEPALTGAQIEYKAILGETSRDLRWRKTNDWGFSPKGKKPERHVYFLDISRTLPLDATAGYAKIAKTAISEVGNQKVLTPASMSQLSYVLGNAYTSGRFTKTDVSADREVGLLTKACGEISQFHQGAGEDEILDIFLLIQNMPNNSLLVIDEVENSLHPSAQRRFVRYLLSVAKSKKIQIILSTHSPYILEELPEVARIMLLNTNNGKEIIPNVSVNFALSSIDDTIHPELYVYVEDEEAQTLLQEILKTAPEYDEHILSKIFISFVGSYSVVETLSKLAKAKKLPYKSIGIVDGDEKSNVHDSLSLPKTVAPERLVFLELKQLGWNNLDTRFNIGAGSLYKMLDDSILLPDHHDWTTFVGDKIHKSKDYVWSILCEEWCKQCLCETDRDELVQKILALF